jgi:mannose-6-phosphate isomerase-like protein (cupin superfamily)
MTTNSDVDTGTGHGRPESSPDDRRLNAEADGRTNRRPSLATLAEENLRGLTRLREQWRHLPMIPRIVLDRSDGQDNSWPGFDIRTILLGDESAGRFTFHDIILAPGAELPPHRVQQADTYWYVLDGQAHQTVGSRSETVARDGFAYCPEGTVQAIANRSAAPTQLFMWSSPAGSERAFAAVHRLANDQPGLAAEAYLRVLEPFGYHFGGLDAEPVSAEVAGTASDRIEARIDSFADYSRLRQRWTARRPVPRLVHDRRTRLDIPIAGQDTKVLLSGDESSGRAVVFHYGIEPGYLAPPHHQPSEEEIFLVVEGDLELTAGNATTVVPRGGFGFVPRFATHAFRNPGRSDVRTVTVNSPAGHERGFEMLVREGDSPRLPELLVAHGWQVHQEYRPGGQGDSVLHRA